MNRIGRSTIICLLIATAPIWALLARKLSSQLLESVTTGRADKTIRLTRGRMELGALEKVRRTCK